MDPTNDKQWHDRESSLNGIAYSYINNALKPKGSALVSEIRNDLKAYYNMTDKGNVESTLLRISADPKTEAAVEPNTNKIRFVLFTNS